MEKNIKISISSKQNALARAAEENVLSSSAENYIDEKSDASSDEIDNIVLFTDGKLKIENGRAEISYEESEATGMEGSLTTLSFSLDEPSVVTMMREGAVAAAMVFEDGKRHICVYDTGIIPFELCIDTLHVRNDLLTRGSLFLDYIIEIKGGEAGRTKFEMKITEEKEAKKKPLDEYGE